MTNETARFNRQYRDTLFKAIFKDKARLLSLYNALNGTSYTNPDDIEFTTIENVIYVTMKNDLSFLIASEMNLYEQQSSFNPNMPLRGLMYFAQLYQQHLTKIGRDLYGTSLVKIPAPQFIVFYNGAKDLADRTELRLSDAFEKPADGFEWTATVVNINSGKNEALLKKCKPLYDYSEYVNRIKRNAANGMAKDDAIQDALDRAIRGNLLDGFFKMQKAEVLNMSLTEFDQEEYDRNRREEGRSEGIAIGERQGIAIGERRGEERGRTAGIAIGIAEGERRGEERERIANACNFLAMGLSPEQVAQGTRLPLEQVLKLANEL